MKSAISRLFASALRPVRPLRKASRFAPHLERLDDRVVPAIAQIENVSVTNYARAIGSDGTFIDQKGHGSTANSYANGAEGRAYSDDWQYGSDAIITYDSLASAYDYYGDSSSALAFTNGSFNVRMVADPEWDEFDGEQIIVRAISSSYYQDGNTSFLHSVNGHANYTGDYYFLTTIGAVIPASFNLTASASAAGGSSGSAFSSIRRQLQFQNVANAIRVTGGSDMTGYEGESLRMSGPLKRWTTFDENFTYRYDLDNDGVWDYEGPLEQPTFTWQQLVDLGLTASDTPYTYRVQVEQPLTHYGIAGSWSSEGTGQITMLPPRYRSHMTVSTPFDLDPSETVFGPYLPGVALTVPFTILLDRDIPAPSHVGYEFNGGTFFATRAQASDPYVWKINVNPGIFALNNTGLKPISFFAIKLKANYNYDVLGYYDAKLNITATRPDFELTVAAASGVGPTVNAEQARLINGVTANMRLTGEFTNVPRYYHSMLTVASGATYRNAQATSDTSAVIEFTRDVRGLAVGLNTVTANIANRSTTYFGDTLEKLRAIAKPNWFTGGTAAFDQTTGSYRFTNPIVSLLSSKGPLANPPALAWLNALTANLKSEQRLTAFLNLRATIDGTAPIDWSESSLSIQASVLGKPVWNEVYSGAALSLTGGLDSWTFNPAGLALALAAPVNLGSKTLLGRPATLTRTIATPAGNKVVTLRFDSTLTGDVTGNAGLKLNSVNNQVLWIPDGTFFSLESAMTATPTVSVAVANGWLTSYAAAGSMQLNFTLEGTVRYGGVRTSPVVAANPTYRALLDADFYFVINGTRVGGAPFSYDSRIEDPRDGRVDNRIEDAILFKF